MDFFKYAYLAAPAVISISSVIFCIVRGKGRSRKKMIFSALLLVAMVMICFGGEAILSRVEMGWRCTPFNTMLFLCCILFVITLWYCMCELYSLGETSHHFATVCVSISLILVMLTALAIFFIYLSLSSWHDGLSTYKDQIIVYANDQHGGSCSWRYYHHINSLVHGAEITQYGWHGITPHF